MKKLGIERIGHDDRRAVVYRLEGRMMDTKEAYAFLEEARGELKKGCRLILVNLSKVDYLSSSGIGILAACYTSARNAGARMGVVGASEPARKVLELVCLWDALERFETEELGLASAL